MYAKIFQGEGDYVSVFTCEPVNLQIAEVDVITPDGNKEGWLYFDNEEQILKFFGVRKKLPDEPVEIAKSTEVPDNILLEVELSPYNNIRRIAYWAGDVQASELHFRIDFLVKHIDNPDLDKWIYTYVDKKTFLPFTQSMQLIQQYFPAFQLDWNEDTIEEYYLFLKMAEQIPLPLLIQFGINKADLDGTINKRLYNI